MRTISLFLFAGTVAFGAVGDISSGAAFLAAAKVADRVQIETTKPEPEFQSVVLSKTDEISAFVELFRFSDFPLRGEKIVVDGKEAWMVTPCQCFGDYIVRFSRKDRVIVSITLHHQQFIRVGLGMGGQEFDLIPSSGTKIDEYLYEVVKKGANHSPQHNARRSKDLMLHPESFHYDEWCAGILARRKDEDT